MNTEEGQRGTKRDKRGTNPIFVKPVIARVYEQEGQEGQSMFRMTWS